jgi:hypothetical protein
MAAGLIHAFSIEMHREMLKDQERKTKSILDEYETEEFDQRISYAREFNLSVKLTVWVMALARKLLAQFT